MNYRILTPEEAISMLEKTYYGITCLPNKKDQIKAFVAHSGMVTAIAMIIDADRVISELRTELNKMVYAHKDQGIIAIATLVVIQEEKKKDAEYNYLRHEKVLLDYGGII